ncbi:MAG TPA: phosphoglucosamine mutase [Planctomycetota bacterium]|nr:phosphoglucosamine mutase [Planctomycetota bacterium]
MTQARIFGTDGVRGRAGEGWLTTDAVSALGRTVGAVLGGESRSKKKRRVLLGHDGRRSGPELCAALARGFAARGLEPVSVGLITTPGLAWLVRTQDFELGAMVSASHNPAADNGIKLFTGTGEKLSDEIENEIERRWQADPSPVATGPVPAYDENLELLYLARLVDKVGANLKLDGLVLALDCANGGGSRVAPRVFGRLGAQVTSIAAEPDGDNINRDCGSTHPEALQSAVRRSGAALGIALDGDGDRCLLVDEKGQLVHGDGILTLLARHAMAHGAWKDPRLVATVMSNKGLSRALREVGVGVVGVDVGDRNVVEALKREKLCLGGEQSGHIVFGPENFFIGDGIYTALRVLRVLRDSGESLSSLAGHYRPFPQVLLNVPVARKPPLSSLASVREAVQAVEADLGEDGRVLLRYSGTEDLARVMVEGPDHDWILRRAKGLAELLSRELAS